MLSSAFQIAFKPKTFEKQPKTQQTNKQKHWNAIPNALQLRIGMQLRNSSKHTKTIANNQKRSPKRSETDTQQQQTHKNCSKHTKTTTNIQKHHKTVANIQKL